MLKLGLKKKKKGKKKKDQELFTEEELEQYKREHQHHPPAETSASAAVTTAAEEEQSQQQSDVLVGHDEKDEEWSKFALLTTGIDSILKKTQGDLDRIKSTSFFKRVAPPRPKEPEVVEEVKKPETPEEERRVKQLLGAVVELSDSEEESDHDDVDFETSYIEKVQTGELEAYVADLDEEEDQGPDPFDTGYADRVIKGPEVSARGKKIINIGSAVEVLTGKVEAANQSIVRQRRARRGIQNLLLESFEANEEEKSPNLLEGEQSEGAPAVAKTLLDEPAELDVNAPIDLSVSLHLKLKKQGGDENDSKEPEISDDILKVVELKVRSTTPQFVQEDDSADWAEFEIKKEESADKPARPLASPRKVKLQTPASNLAILLGEDESPEDFEDPFDTTYVEAIIPKPIEYDDDFDPRAAAEAAEAEERARVEAEDAERAAAAAAEAEANKVSDDEFDPRADEEIDIFDTSKASNVLKVFQSTSLTVERKQQDLLSTSQTDISSIAPTLAPSGELVDAEEEIDPFDTSAVDALVKPGKTELKFLEKELLEDEDDFDPRAGEEKPSIDDLRRRKSSLCLQLSTSSPKIGVSFAIPTPDLLKIDAESSGKNQKPLTPYYNRNSSLALEEELVDEDPFDTSYVNVEPTTVELDILEKEILEQPAQSLSDDDFDPRAVTPEPPRANKPAEDLLLASDSHNTKVLTPARGDSLTVADDSEVDPFDTSTVSYKPGTVELQLLEDELIEKRPEPPASNDILSDTQDNSIYDKILTPQPSSVDIEAEDDIDPFDTSFVTNLQPGETEIKLIENELIN